MIAVEKYNSIDNEDIEAEKQANNDSTSIFFAHHKTLQAFLKKIISFICYGPGVLGFLWLIGHILKR